MKKIFYLTTPLYYVNDAPHIGHAYTTLAADVLARYKKMKGEPVHFLTGTDEHGANIEKIARASGKTPVEWADGISAKFQELWKRLDVQSDDFIRTTEPRHEKAAQAVFEKLIRTGDIYKSVYEGWYCLPCENFFEESELNSGKCPIHDRPVEKVREESYFFKLSKYENRLLEHYEKNPHFLSPKHRALEILNFVKSGLKDISVSRTKVAWGINVNSDPGHTIYVWFEALQNYITAAGYTGDSGSADKPSKGSSGQDVPPFNDLWPADVHLVGKEIYRFHAIIWPAMLMALELPLPKTVFAHGWWTINGEKMSKSRGNFIDPHEIINEYGADPFRYFLFRQMPFGSDGDFSLEGFKNRYNSDLANDLGNLLSRVTNMVDKYAGGELPAKPPQGGSFIFLEVSALSGCIDKAMESFAFSEALDTIWSVIARLNQQIDREKPWAMAKTDPAGVKLVLFDLVWCLRMVAGWIYPFMPQTSAKMQSQLGVRKFGENGLPEPAEDRIQKCPPLFPRK